MAWEQELFGLLDDLEQQAQQLYADERELELADRSRSEYATVTLASRLAASRDREVALELLGVGTVRGTLRRATAEWCLVESAGHDWVVRVASIAAVTGASERSLPEAAWSVVQRLGLTSALRRVAESGEPCVVHLLDGRRHDVRLVRVGSDFAEVVMGDGAGARTALLGFSALAAVQSRGGG